jgi:hypothetical protein
MKKSMLLAVLLAMGYVCTSQAVVIHWAVTTPVPGALNAALVYVNSGAEPPTWDGTGYNSGSTRIATAEALPDYTVGAQATTFTAGSGGYYLVLFNAAGQYAVSTSWLSWDDKLNGSGSPIGAITSDIMFPAETAFGPSVSFGGWVTVPEPSTAMLLMAGAAMAALRRRKRV